ncbi:hypothetical protein J7T55_010912 [Diaporthe amygdali]|uniref:uncharacterized protein n=1 Tax=Phomopsis amygdali TaxID=1214568 RepID=UPI0022FDE648|nr:uncharacterized protein J7T55_010912 [Diaporthe amygdali]KAJ0104446.1 hypothetical protein J7T55_010912 [Diaporthe amygdali]
MASEVVPFKKLPQELRNEVWTCAMISKHGVHFLKLDNDYNGTYLFPAAEISQPVQGPGISEVSSMSAACDTARLSIAGGSNADGSLVARFGLSRIILNFRVALGALIPASMPSIQSYINPLKRPHIKVDKDNDLFCFSTFRSPWFPNYHFSGGTSCSHPDFRDTKLVAISMPGQNRATDDFICKDCFKDYTQDPGQFWGQLEVCIACMASWTAQLRDVERVYLIVPGLPQAQADDEQIVYRWGAPAAMQAAIAALPRPPSSYDRRTPMHMPAWGTRPALRLLSSETVEAFGPDGPQSFHGCGITLFEVPASAVPDETQEILDVMFEETCNARCLFTVDADDFSPFPSNPVHCGGVVEFKFLSY